MILPDLLKPNLKVVFCGTAVGSTSAKFGWNEIIKMSYEKL